MYEYFNSGNRFSHTILSQSLLTAVSKCFISGLKPGKHIARVFEDDDDLGACIINVLDGTDVAMEALKTAITNAPLEMMKKLLQLDSSHIDSDLALLLRDPPEVVLWQLLRHGDHTGSAKIQSCLSYMLKSKKLLFKHTSLSV